VEERICQLKWQIVQKFRFFIPGQPSTGVHPRCGCAAGRVLKHDHFFAAWAGKRSSRCVLFVPVAEVMKRLPVASHDRRIGTFRECKLPCVVFPKSPAVLCRPSLELGAFCRVLKPDVLRNLPADKLHALAGIIASFEKFGD
jgi:hypothetical protein